MEGYESKDSDSDHAANDLVTSRYYVAGMATYQDSKTTNGVSSLIKLLFQPPPNSTTRYTHLVKIVPNATVKAIKNPLNLPLDRNFLYAGFFQD